MSNLAAWRKALDATTSDGKRQFFYSEMIDLLEAGEKAVAEARGMDWFPSVFEMPPFVDGEYRGILKGFVGTTDPAQAQQYADWLRAASANLPDPTVTSTMIGSILAREDTTVASSITFHDLDETPERTVPRD